MKDIVPAYPFSVAEVIQTADIKYNFAERDAADMIPQGITAARLIASRAQVDTLRSMPDDMTNLAIQSMITDLKNDSRAALEDICNSNRRMCKNALSDRDFEKFNFTDFATLSDADLILAARRFHTLSILPAFAALILPFGGTAPFLAGLLADVVDFDEKIDEVKLGISSRRDSTQSKIILANSVYREVVRVCDTGKNIYQDITPNPSKYNDYIIGTSSGPAGLFAKIMCVIAGTGTGLADVALNFITPALPEIFHTDPDGKKNVPLESGTTSVTVEFSRPDYITKTETFEVSVGMALHTTEMTPV